MQLIIQSYVKGTVDTTSDRKKFCFLRLVREKIDHVDWLSPQCLAYTRQCAFMTTVAASHERQANTIQRNKEVPKNGRK